MSSIQVKGVPEEVHAVLRRRAAVAGQSMQEYLLALLRQDAETPTLEEVLDRIEHRNGGEADFDTAARLVREERRQPMIVVDASALVTALLDDGGDGRRARLRMRGERLRAPEIIDLEVVSALRRLDAADRLDARRADQALIDLGTLHVVRVGHRPLLPRCWELRHNLTVYDAAYVALAELLDTPLITADGQLARSPAVRCRFELLR